MNTTELMKVATQANAPVSEMALIAEAVQRGAEASAIRELVLLKEHMEDRKRKDAFNAAMVVVQAEMPRVAKDGRILGKGGAVQSRYATLERIDESVRPIYQRHGFSISVSVDSIEGGKYWAKAIVRHADGHSEEYRMPLALDQSGAKNDTQGMGSTMSYARRYLLCSIFSIVTEGEDTDGQPREQRITQDQADTLNTMLTDTNKDRGRFMAWASTEAGYRVEKLADLPARLFPVAVQIMQGKK